MEAALIMDQIYCELLIITEQPPVLPANHSHGGDDMRRIARILIMTTLFFHAFMIAAAPALAAGRLFVLGVDETGSYALRNMSIKRVERFIAGQMRPGDTLIARRITGRSYLDVPENLLLPSYLKLPEIGAGTSNRFNVLARKKHQRLLRGIALLKKRAIKYIHELKPVKANKTDIYGFLAAGADYLALSKKTEKFILIASDMEDNCSRKSEINLAGAKVIVMAFEKNVDPAKTGAVKRKWRKIFRKMQAGSVIFLPPDQDLGPVL